MANESRAVIESNKHNEAAKYISQTEHQRNLSALYINEKKLASLPADLQKIVLDAAREAADHERKKDAEFVAGAADRLKSTMGAVIPPSILMVIYGATAGVSIGALLLGGILPGILMGLGLMVQSHIFALKYDFPREHPRFLGLGAVWDGIKTAGWPLGVPVIIVVGMVGGVFTPTESASIAAVYSLFVTLVVFRSLKLRQMTRLFAETTIQLSQVLFCLGGASIFGWLLAYYQVPQIVTDFIVSFTRDPIVIMIVIVNVLLGTFMDALPAILIFVPIIHPLAVAVGIHPVHLGVIVVMTQSFGLLTPPLGMVAMTACAVAGMPMMKIQKLLHIMMIPLLIVIVLCALAPWTVLLIPKLLVPKWL